MGNRTFKVICFSPWGNKRSFSKAEDSTIKNNPPETVTRKASPKIFTPKLKRGLMKLTRGEIKYQKNKVRMISTTRLKMDRAKKVHFPLVFDRFSKSAITPLI